MITDAVSRRRLGRWLDRWSGGELGGTAVLAVLVGAGTALSTWGLLWACSALLDLSTGSPGGLAGAGGPSWVVRLLAPAVGGLLCGLAVQFLGRGAFGQDVAELVGDVGRRGGRVDLRRALAKPLAAIAAIGSGGSAAVEGPIVHAGGALGSIGGRLVAVEAQRLKVLVACGTAAGISAVFSAPVAGMLFALEVFLGAVHVRTFLPLALASAVAAALREVLFGLAAPRALDLSLGLAGGAGWEGGLALWQLALCLVVGALGGVAGASLTRGLRLFKEIGDALPGPRWLVPAAGGLLVGAAALAMPEVAGTGCDAVEATVHSNPATFGAIVVLLCLAVWKLLATFVTLGTGGSGGILSAAMLAGAALGAAVGGLLLLVAGPEAMPPVAVAAFALAGVAATVAATTHATLAAVVIVFEMTRQPHLVLPSILAASAALLVSSRLSKETVHTLKLRTTLSPSTPKPACTPAPRSTEHSELLKETPVSSLLRGDVERVSPGTALADLVRRLVEGGSVCQQVVDSAGKLVGTVSMQEVGPLLREDGVEGLLLAYDVMQAPPVAVQRADSLATCMERFGRVDCDELPVVDGAGLLVGRVTRKDVLAFYAREVIGDGRRDSAGMTFIARKNKTTDIAEPTAEGEEDSPSEILAGVVEVPEGHVVETLPVPPGFAGRTLKELNLRSRFGVSVISMRRRTAAGGRISLVSPDPNLALREGDMLVLTGPEPQVEKLRKLVGHPDAP